MIIDGVFNTLPDQIEEYQTLLKARLAKDSHGGNGLLLYLCKQKIRFIYE